MCISFLYKLWAYRWSGKINLEKFSGKEVFYRIEELKELVSVLKEDNKNG